MFIKAKIAKNCPIVNICTTGTLGVSGGMGEGCCKNGKANTKAQKARCKKTI